MKRSLIAIAATLALGSTAAFADNNYTFDDAYWKQQETVRSMQSAPSVEATLGKYHHVDGYNN
jgi:hypothetical protein